MTIDRERLPEPGPTRAFTFPAIDKSTLPNGLRVWSVHHAQVPIVAFMLLVRRGASSDPIGKDGLAAVIRLVDDHMGHEPAQGELPLTTQRGMVGTVQRPDQSLRLLPRRGEQRFVKTQRMRRRRGPLDPKLVDLCV